MNDKWFQATLGEISKMQYGYTASAKNDEVGPKFLRITDIVPNYINWNRVPFCKISNDNYKKFKIKKGDILVARTGATAGFAKLIRKDVDSVFASYLIRIKPSTDYILADYLGIIIESEVFKTFVNASITGAAQPQANAPVLKNFNFSYPPIIDQKNIVNFILLFDDIMQNNLRRIQILEEISQNLYEKWFVNFKFPGYEKVKMVDSELGEIPEGWEVKKLNDFVDVRDGTHDTPKKIKKGISLITTKNIKGGYLLKSDYFISQDDFQEVSKRSKVEKWNILISMIGTVGEIHLVDYYPEYAIKNIGLIRANNSKKSLFIFHYLKSEVGKEEIKSRMTGASQQFLSLTNLRNINLVIPNNSLLVEFDNHVFLLQTKIRNLIEKNKVLRQTRDLLLPRLISGEIEL